MKASDMEATNGILTERDTHTRKLGKFLLICHCTAEVPDGSVVKASMSRS